MSLFGSIASAAFNPVGTMNNLLYNQLPGPAKWAIPGYAEQQNYDLQQQQFGYSKDLQQQLFAREDNAVQRRVADLKAAGLSPTLAAGSAASAGPVVSTTAPQRAPTPLLETAMGVMAMLKQKQDISRTEAEIDNIMAQTDRTRVNTIGDSAISKMALKAVGSQLGMRNASAQHQSVLSALDAIRAQAAEHDLSYSRRAGTTTHPSAIGAFVRDLIGDLPRTRVNRAGQSSSW